MKKIIRITESELNDLVEKSARRIMKEHVDYAREIALAQKELHKMGSSLSSIGMRLEGTAFYSLYRKMADAMKQLNNELIKHLNKK